MQALILNDLRLLGQDCCLSRQPLFIKEKRPQLWTGAVNAIPRLFDLAIAGGQYNEQWGRKSFIDAGPSAIRSELLHESFLTAPKAALPQEEVTSAQIGYSRPKDIRSVQCFLQGCVRVKIGRR